MYETIDELWIVQEKGERGLGGGGRGSSDGGSGGKREGERENAV